MAFNPQLLAEEVAAYTMCLFASVTLNRAVRAHFDALVFARRHCSVGGRHDRGRFLTRVWRDLRTRQATRQAAIGQNRRKSAVLARPFLWRPRIAMSTERAQNVGSQTAQLRNGHDEATGS